MKTAPAPRSYATIAPLWRGETAVVIGSGPSLTAADVAFARGRGARLVAVKDAYQLAVDADCLYACDARFWRWHRGFPEFRGLKYSIDPLAVGPELLRNTGETGLELDPSGVRTGKHSSYQAINVCVHLGVRRILLLGVDMAAAPHGPKYFFGNRPPEQAQFVSPYGQMLAIFPTLGPPLARLGITLINCSRRTALECFPRMTIEEAFA